MGSKANISLSKKNCLAESFSKCLCLKTAVIDSSLYKRSNDEFEKGDQRIFLNYGHTIGHAIESISKYSQFLHGEAVSIGMMGAAYISKALGLLSSEEVNRQKVLLENFGLPTKILEEINLDLLLDIMQSDKKIVDSSINWVVLNNIGSASICNSVSRNLVLSSLEKLMIRD